MKRLILPIAILVGLSASGYAQTATVGLQWDPMPTGETWSAVRCYEKVGAAYTKVGEVSMPATQLSVAGVAAGVHTYVCRSYASPWESGDSNAAATGPQPSAPKITVTVTVTVSP